MNKRISALILSVVMTTAAFTLVSCSSDNNSQNPSVSSGTESPDNGSPSEAIISTLPVDNTDSLISEPSSVTAFAKIGDDLPVSRGLVAKMLALAFNDKNSIDSYEREISFSDTTADLWFDRYINACVISGLMSGSGEVFNPKQPLSLAEAQSLLDRLDPLNGVKMQITEENRAKPISYALWTDLYCKLLENLRGEKSVYDTFGIARDEIIVLATPDNNNMLPEWNTITDSGAMSFSGLSMEAYIDKEISILKKEGEIVAVLDIITDTPTIRNAYIIKAAEVGITIFAGGAERTFTYVSPPEKPVDGKICDIKIMAGKALEVKAYKETIRGTIKRVTSEYVELYEYGIVKFTKYAVFYSTADGFTRFRSMSSLIVGTDCAEYICLNGEILASVITKKSTPDKIRAAISTTGFTSLVHEEVKLTATKKFTVTNSSLGASAPETKTYNPGDVFTISKTENNELIQKGRLYINCESGGKIQLLSIERNWPGKESPSYRGSIEIGLENGGYSIVNELSLEEYLYSVIPSEMPSSHGVDAAKVQAITARSFAYNQYFLNRFHKFGAHVDDSVSCQVYNNIPENNTSISACDQTAGLCLTYEGEVISANFFSTSSGMTANSGDVWANSATKQFPTSTAEYLSSVKQYEGDYGDLSKEENAEVFFKDKTVKSWDSGFSWFRWNVTMTVTELENSINQSLKARYETAPKLIKTLQSDGFYKSRPISTIGNLKDIEVVSRGSGGNILTLRIIGTEATVLVSTEYNIRLLLKPVGENIVLNRVDGTTVSNYSLMPSAFFVMEKNYSEEKLSSITFYGGGNGHGVGMSQNGVKGMIEKGFSVEDILKHYYSGTKVEKKY